MGQTPFGALGIEFFNFSKRTHTLIDSGLDAALVTAHCSAYSAISYAHSECALWYALLLGLNSGSVQ